MGEDVYVEVAQPNDNFPVFSVLNERSKRSRNLHRNMLFPLAKNCSVKTLVKELRFLIQKRKHRTGKQGYQGPMIRAKGRALE